MTTLRTGHCYLVYRTHENRNTVFASSVYSICSKPYVVEFLGEKFLSHREITLDSSAVCIRDSLRIVFVTLARKLLAPCPWDLNP
jgi:hypothetical protein